ncbi:MAG: glycosyltransferase family 4 protein [Cyanobacteria bacterium P01_E01_bin.48]
MTSHIVILFINIGSYHAARLRAAHQACQARDWSFTAIQLTDDTLQHPWGDLSREITFPLETLLPVETVAPEVDRSSMGTDGIPALVRHLDRLQPTAVFLPGWGFPIARAGLKWCIQRNVPAILMSESKADDEPRSWWKEWLKSQLYVRKFAAALVGGQHHRDYTVQLGIPSDRIFLGYDAVDNEHFARTAATARADANAARARQPAIPSRPYFICVTRFLPRKNVLALLDAYARYRQAVSADAAKDLVICGSGTGLDEVRSQIQQLHLEPGVHLPGFVSYDTLGDWYGLADALIHPALHEQWGLVLNEAGAAGLPLLSSRTVGAAAELVREGVNGFTFEPTSVADITGVLQTFHALSADERERMGHHSQTIANDFGPHRFGDGFTRAVLTATSTQPVRA